MPLFKKRNKKKKEKPSKNKKIKKKTKIGLRHKNNPKKNTKNIPKKEEENKVTKDVTDEVVAEITPIKKEEKEKDEKKQFSSKKKKNILKKDMKGQPVYLEDTGEQLGIIFDTLTDAQKNVVGYKIKDKKSDSVLSFPLDNFEETKRGFIFIPGWYTNALKIIEKLEFKDKISPDLTALLSDDAVSNEELYEIFVKHDDDMVKYIDDAKSLKGMLTNRLNVLEKQREALKDDLMDLTEKRLIKDIDRKEFSEDVMNHRRKVNILDINIKKCKDLIKRLENTSFGVLNKNNLTPESRNRYNMKNNLTEKISSYQNNEDSLFKKKYFSLKDKYDELEEDYRELKIAVDELVKKERYE